MQQNKTQPNIHQTHSQDLDEDLPQQQLIYNAHDQYNQTVVLDSQPEFENIQKNILLQVLKNSNKNVTRSEFDSFKQQNQPLHKDQNNLDDNDLPQPLQSQQQQSQQAQYLSYIQNPPASSQSDNEPSSPVKKSKILRQKLKGAFKQQFLSILYQSIIYIKKQQRRTKIDDDLLAQRLNDHLIVKTTPQPRSIIGSALLVNGYFICAYALLLARINKSPAILQYIINQFKQKLASIQQNVQQFTYYAQRSIQQFKIYDQQINQHNQNAENSHPRIFKQKGARQTQKSEKLKRSRMNQKANNPQIQQQVSKNGGQKQNENEIQNSFYNMGADRKQGRMNSTRATFQQIMKITRKQSDC